MDKANGTEISAHIKELVGKLVEAVILAESDNVDVSDEIRFAAQTRAVLVGKHLYDDLDYFGAHAANSINTANVDNMVESVLSDIDAL